VFILPNGETIELTGVRSGEFTTMAQNNTTNLAVCAAVMHWVQALGLGEYESLKIQGDDVICSILVADEDAPVVDMWNTTLGAEIMPQIEGFSKVTQIAKTVTCVVNRCGLETNPTKGCVSYDTAEYLKVLIKDGCYCPNNYVMVAGAENVGMADDPISFVSGQLHKHDLAVSRGLDPDIIYRFGILLSLIRLSYRVSVFPRTEDFSHMYYPPWTAFCTPTVLNGLGRSPTMFPCDASPAMIMMMKMNPDFGSYVMDRCGGLKPPNSKDYARIIADMLMGADKRHDFTVQSKLKTTQIPHADLARPFAAGVRDMSESLDASAVRRSFESFDILKRKGIKVLAKEQLYPESARMAVRGVLESNKNVMEFAADMRRDINADTFTEVKPPKFDDASRWIQSFNIYLTHCELPPMDKNGPLRYLHPNIRGRVGKMPWGCSSREAQTNTSKVINMLKMDSLLPRYWTDEALARVIFNSFVFDDVNNLPHILFSIGVSPETVAEVMMIFNEQSSRDAMLQFVSGAFTLNSPLFQGLDRSKASCVPHIMDVSGTRTSKQAFSLMYLIWAYFVIGGGMDVNLTYEQSPDSDSILEKSVSISTALPYVPLLEGHRMADEQRKQFKMY